MIRQTHFRPWGRPGAFWLLVASCLTSPKSLAAQGLDTSLQLDQFAHAAWGAGVGLPHSSVRATVRTRDGYLWIATLGGVTRFDGVRFVTYDRANTLAIANNFASTLEY